MERKDLPNPRIAAILSFVFNGLGQIYNGEIKKGLTLIFLSGLSLLILVIGAVFIIYFIKTFPPISFLIWGLILFFFGLIGIIVIGIYSISDAYNKAKKILEDETKN
jgi:TM2 domain-containing membrane protein YozV